MKLNADGTKAALTINAELTADQVEQLIRALAMLRAQMTPAVPDKPSDAPEGNVPTLTQDSPSLLMSNLASDGTATLRLRNVGLGWTSWRLYPDQLAGLREVLESFNGKPTMGSAGDVHRH